MPKYVQKTDPPVEIVNIEKVDDHPAIVVDPTGFRAPYVVIQTEFGGDQSRVVSPGDVLMIRDGKPVGLMGKRDFLRLYEEVEEPAPPGPTSLSDRIAATLAESFRKDATAVTITLDAGSFARFMSENEDRVLEPVVTYPDGLLRIDLTVGDVVKKPAATIDVRRAPEAPKPDLAIYKSEIEARADHFARVMDFYKQGTGSSKVTQLLFAAMCWCERNGQDFWKAAASIYPGFTAPHIRTEYTNNVFGRFRWRS